MPSFNNNQVNKLFPGLDKIMQGYTGSSNSEASVYGHYQPSGPSPSKPRSVFFLLIPQAWPCCLSHTGSCQPKSHINNSIWNQLIEPSGHPGKLESRNSQSDGNIQFPRQTGNSAHVNTLLTWPLSTQNSKSPMGANPENTRKLWPS
ncbi:hypothetical protein DSO57_1028698 [Entomophthora muscae]|uniref:Uncharacterized protein n=1 Tax=Entomophthora muscae TaxID=34485 RepID=A0ACC2T1M5_9FUNG|nr:hypothetical protein DSO57_1028698 [Entomophthora muscae]